MADSILTLDGFAADGARQEVLGFSGPALLVRGPAGSGKTRLAAEKVRRDVIGDALAQGQRVLCMSFSRAARTRMAEAVRTHGARAVTDVLTFDAFCSILVRKHGDRLGLTGPLRLRQDGRLTCLEETGDGHYAGFDDISRMACDLLSSASMAATLADCYPVVVVDEFQDTRPVHYELLTAFRRKGTRLYAFGDEFQSINSFANDGFAPLDTLLADGAEEIAIQPVDGYQRFKDLAIGRLAETIRSGGTDCLPVWKDWLKGYPVEDAFFASKLRYLVRDLLKRGHSRIAVLCKRNADVFQFSELMAMPNQKWGPVVRNTAEVSEEFRSDHHALLSVVWQTMLSASDVSCAAVRSILAAFAKSKRSKIDCGPRGSTECTCMKYAGELSGMAASDLPVVIETCETLCNRLGTRKGPKVQKLGESLERLSGACRNDVRTTCTQDARLLVSRLVAQTLMLADRGAVAEGRGVRVMTINQAKNRQFDAVVLIYNNRHGWKTEAASADTTVGDRMLLYEAVSRAVSEFRLLYYEDKTKPALGPILTPLLR